MKSTVFKIVNKNVIHIANRGIEWSTLICLIASFILELYCEYAVPQAFYIGIPLFKSALFFIVMFIICGFVFDKIAN